MMIERIIELQLRGPGPLGKRVLLQLVIFMTKKNFKENLRVDYYLLLKCSQRQSGPTWTKSLTIKI